MKPRHPLYKRHLWDNPHPAVRFSLGGPVWPNTKTVAPILIGLDRRAVTQSAAPISASCADLVTCLRCTAPVNQRLEACADLLDLIRGCFLLKIVMVGQFRAAAGMDLPVRV